MQSCASWLSLIFCMKKTPVNKNIVKRSGLEKSKTTFEEKLVASNVRYQQLLESAKDGILVLNAETGIIVDVNPFLIDLIGCSNDIFTEKPIWEIGFFKNIVASKDQLLELQQHEYVHYEDLLIETFDGRNIHVEFTINVYLVNGHREILCTIHDITKRKHAEELLRENEERFRSLYNNSTIGIYRTNSTGKIEMANPTLIKMLGYSSFEDLAKRELNKEGFGLDHSRSEFQALIERVGEVRGYESTWIKNDGTTIYIRESARVIKDINSTSIYYEGSVENITERKLAEESLLKLKKAVDNSGEIIFLTDQDGIFTFANPAFTAIYGYTTDEIIGKVTPRILKSGLIDANDYRQYWENLKNGNEVKGEFINKRKDGTLIHVEISSNPVFDEKKNIIGFLGIQRDITERKQSEEALRKSQQIIEGIVNTIPVRVFWKDKNLVYLGCNNIFAQDAGFDQPKEIIGKDDYQMVWRDQAELYRSDDRLVIESGKPRLHIEEAQTTPEGKSITLLTSKIPLLDPNREINGVLGTYVDITERKQAEELLKKSEEFLKETQKIASLGSYVLDIKTGTWESSEILDSIFGIEADYDKSVKGWTDIIHPEWRHLMQEYLLNEVVGHKMKFDKEYKIVRVNDKAERWVRGMGELVLDEDNQPIQMVGTIKDITDRKQVEETLRENEATLDRALKIAKLGTWEYDVEHDQFKFNDQFYTLLRTTLERENGYIMSSEKYAQKFVHPDDRALVRLEIQRAIETTDPNFSFRLDHRIVYADGEIGHFNVNIRIKKDSNGRTVKTYGVNQDITERKQADEALRESQSLYHSFIEQLPNAVFRKDKAGRYIFVNSQFCKLKRLTKEDFIGKTPVEVAQREIKIQGEHVHATKYADDGEDVHNTILQTGELIEKEEEYPDVNGRMQFMQVLRMPVFNAAGTIIGTQGIMFDITNRKQFEESLKLFRTLLDKSNDAIEVIDMETGQFIDVNERACIDLGYSRSELLNMKVFDIDPNQSQESFQSMMDGVQQSNSMIIETIHRHRDGSVFPVEVNVTIVQLERMYTIAIVRDITERKRVEEEITMLAHSLRSINECVSITDLDDKIIFVNESFLKTYGYNENELVGKSIDIIRSPNNSPDLVEKILPATKLGGWTGELLNRRKNGTEFPIHLSTKIISDKDGNSIGLIGVASDITERKHTERELIKSKEKAEESDRLKSSFLANMSHEIRTPMNGILGFTEMLKEPLLTGEEQQEYIDIIEKSGNRMLDIINDIINISKIESGQVEISISNTNINKQIEDILKFFKPEAEKKKLQIFYRTSLSNDKANIKTDGGKVYAVLTNLVKNALKFTHSGSIEFGYEKKGEFLEFFVKDTGTGVSPEQKEIIFERFRQGSDSLTRNYEGAGLGLSISKAYVEMLGGRIWMESNPDPQLATGMKGGTTFYFSIPTEFVQKEKTFKTTSLPDNGIEAHDRKLKILIAEDDEASEMLVSIAVKNFAKEILKATTGIQSVEACRNNPDLDLVLMDIKMPEMDGYEATREIRKFNKEVIIIAQTAYALPDDHKKAIEAGCNDYISKPINREGLKKLINEYFF